jgi:hypothetical protein
VSAVRLVTWVLADDARTRRAQSLLYPLCATVIVVVALMALGHVPALVAAGLLGPLALLRRSVADRGRDHDSVVGVAEGAADPLAAARGQHDPRRAR